MVSTCHINFNPVSQGGDIQMISTQFPHPQRIYTQAKIFRSIDLTCLHFALIDVVQRITAGFESGTPDLEWYTLSLGHCLFSLTSRWLNKVFLCEKNLTLVFGVMLWDLQLSKYCLCRRINYHLRFVDEVYFRRNCL